MLAKIKDIPFGTGVGDFIFMPYMKLDGVWNFSSVEELDDEWYQTDISDAVYHISWLEIVEE
ncbi:MAG TPA: hypothetical protein DDY71_11140 [Spirochaetia bacterium]|nr:hypothetical protein [Spirochaetia bacterium]